ncbi:MAG TPA: SpoIIE family protein phosphatase [Candidatus Nitrosotalea sp.]|nr:SpoIIE family protein phosphatase [Candidatus Nitrosotalea sp.]
MAPKKPIRVLIVEDSEFDARVLVNNLRQAGYDVTFRRVDSAATLRDALTEGVWEVILSDYNLPGFSAPEALAILQQSGLDLPFIIISGGIGEDVAVAAMKAGAHDYLMKGNLARLAPAVERELREAGTRVARREAENALRESEQRYRLLWENSTDAVVLMDSDTIIQFVNPAAEEIFGYRTEELMGQRFTRLLADGAGELFREWAYGFFRSEDARSKQPPIETVGRHKTGKEIILDVGFNPIDLKGSRSLVAFIRDITERKRAEQELRENEEQFRVAREIQQRLFPKSAPILPGFDIAGVSQAAEATGGDYFDYLTLLNDRIGIAVGDVTGHGIGPALLMAETRAYLRIVGRNRDDAGEILTRANRVLAEDVGYERFVTVLLVSLDPQRRVLAYANAGHPVGYVLDASGEVKAQLKRTGLPLGIKPDTVYPPATEVALASGDVILLLTDGIDEAVAPGDQLFGVERALEVVRSNRTKTAGEIVDALFAAVRAFSNELPQLDDATAVVIKVI